MRVFEPEPKTVFIDTVGCQMNVLDSELVAAQLRQAGYRLTDNLDRADTVLLNTCSVRQHAEDKVYSLLGRLRLRKEEHPEMVIGVMGCMAQKDREGIFRRCPHVEVVCGPGQLARITDLIAEARDRHHKALAVSLPRRGKRMADVRASFDSYNPQREPTMRPRPFQAFVRIMSGCDKFCSYCVVPGVRGPEQCRAPETIQEEVRRLADQGVVEITLLGQTVNSYRYPADDGRTWHLADLLARIDPVDGIRRIKFITSFPRHMKRDLLQAVRDLPKVCPYLHVPAQSGSDRMLKAMKRGYTLDAYRRMVAEVREIVPEAALSSDFIVGFPGETEDDVRQTMALMTEARFKQAFVFKYSPRPGTPAAELPDDVPTPVKKQRNQALLALQERISSEDNRQRVGRTVNVLVEGRSKLGAHRAMQGSAVPLTGRAPTDHIVAFAGPESWIGRIVPVTITGSRALVLFAEAPETVAASP